MGRIQRSARLSMESRYRHLLPSLEWSQTRLRLVLESKVFPDSILWTGLRSIECMVQEKLFSLTKAEP